MIALLKVKIKVKVVNWQFSLLLLLLITFILRFFFSMLSKTASSLSPFLQIQWGERTRARGQQKIRKTRAPVACVSVWFRSKDRPRNGILGFGRARNETRALLITPFFARSLTLVPRSLLLNRTETLATQANAPASPVSRLPGLQPRTWSLGTLRKDDDDGSENDGKKMNLRSFKLNRVFMDRLNMSNAGDFSWSCILKDFIQAQKDEGKFVVVCPRPPWWCYTRRFATTIFSITQRCNIVATLF